MRPSAEKLACELLLACEYNKAEAFAAIRAAWKNSAVIEIAMDPDAMLADIRHTVKEFWRGRTDLDMGKLVELIDDLDQWITKGGLLPGAWRRCNPTRTKEDSEQ